MKKILFINPSLRLKSPTKFLPVGIASVMTYLETFQIDFDFLDIDINELEDSQIEDYLDQNRYDVILSGSIVTHYKWMKWLTHTVRKYNKNSIIIIGNSVAGSIPNLFLKNSSANIAILGEGEVTSLELIKRILKNELWENLDGLAFKKKTGEVIVNKNRQAQKKLDDFPMINWSKFDTEKYFSKSYAAAKSIDDETVRVMPVVTARGCAFRCTSVSYTHLTLPTIYSV